jgi:hypothetical protein
MTHRRRAAESAGVAWTTLRNLRVPENRRVKLEDVTDVLSEGGRLKPFSPRHVRHFAESHLLDFVGPKLPSRLIGRSHPVGDELLQLRDVRPAVPAAQPAREAEVHGWINDVSRNRFQPPLSGASLRVRATSIVDQSIPLRTTLKPIDSSAAAIVTRQRLAATKYGASVGTEASMGLGECRIYGRFPVIEASMGLGECRIYGRFPVIPNAGTRRSLGRRASRAGSWP